MAYDALTIAEIAAGKPVTNGLMTKIKDNLDYLYGTVGTLFTNQVLNSSFEIDSDANGVPDNWTRSLYPGGAGGIYTAAPAHGAKSVYLTHPGGAGNGGGYYESDYVEVSSVVDYWIFFYLWATAAGVKNMVQIRYFDKDKSELGAGSPETIYTSVANYTTPHVFRRRFTPPATTCFIKIRLIGGYTDTAVAGTIYFDKISLRKLRPVNIGDTSLLSIGGGSNDMQAPVKVAEAAMDQRGEARIKFTLVSDHNGFAAYGRIYKNGSPIGTTRSNSTTTPVQYSEDITGLVRGDLIQLYAWHQIDTYISTISGGAIFGDLYDGSTDIW